MDKQALKGEIVAKGYTQESFAKAIEVHPSTLNGYLNAAFSRIPIKVACKIIEALNLSVEKANQIFFGE